MVGETDPAQARSVSLGRWSGRRAKFKSDGRNRSGAGRICEPSCRVDQQSSSLCTSSKF
jgi:hypothetical protein